MKTPTRKKTNFMIKITLLDDIRHLIPDGQRSDFVNDSLEEALETFRRRKAFEAIDELREQLNLKMSMKEFKKLKNYGRK